MSLFAEVSRYHICLLRFNFISFYCERINDDNQNWRNMIKWFNEPDTYGFRSRCNWFCCSFNREFLGHYGQIIYFCVFASLSFLFTSIQQSLIFSAEFAELTCAGVQSLGLSWDLSFLSSVHWVISVNLYSISLALSRCCGLQTKDNQVWINFDNWFNESHSYYG